MTSRPVPSGMFMIVSPNGINIPQMEQPGPSPQSNNNLKKGLKEEYKVLGTIQIMAGLMILSVGIIVACPHDASHFKPSHSKVVSSAYPFLSGVSFIISGSLSIASEKKKMRTLNRVSLAANVISGIKATAGLILFSVILPEVGEDLAQCIQALVSQEGEERDDSYHYPPHPSPWMCHMAASALTGTVSVMLIFTALELCVALFAAIFDWRRLSVDSSGSVLFLPHGHHINSNLRTNLYDPAYEQLGASP
ncbi:membrane-spanning 4-domains subfamily A member 6A-like [Dromiciops gliroides]|uniref:membrane-spanning 4-domains subfamily A member 6A-like n=1 Tax=Dromiciops gliroides TaxID=33562 RepID=UPI001CC7D83A|nr:membrane-spanning 4-domains subfamily A member 6A-like [Dromiciops gliroides]